MATGSSSVPREYLPVRVPQVLPGAIIGSADGLVLRHARDDDADAIVELVSRVWSEYPGKILVAANDMPELLEPASAYARGDGRFWVVEANGKIIGTIALMPSAEPGVVELQKLYVARDMRKNGLGSFLCYLVEREARERGAHAIELWSDVKLLDAHRRYEQLGYHRGQALKTYHDTSSTIRSYYRKELDADRPPLPTGEAMDASERWQTLFHLAAERGAVQEVVEP